MSIELKDLVKTLDKKVKDIKKQMKFASMKAINDCAFEDVRPALIKEYTDSFHVRNTNLPKRVQIKKATKQKLSAVVEFPFDWFYLNTKGGTKKPEKAPQLFVPIKGLEDARNDKGKIKPSMKPKSLLKYSKENPLKTKGKTKRPHAFLLHSKKRNRTFIAIRDKENRKKLKFIYIQVPTAKIKQRWDFEKIGEEAYLKNIERRYNEWIKKAIETAE